MSHPGTESQEPASTPQPGTSGWRHRVLLLVAPLLLIGPALLPGMRFLPQLPVQLAPLAAEHPAANAAAAEGANLVMPDRILPFLTDQIEIRRQLAEGTLPTWEPKLGMGVPLFGGSIVSPVYPPNWLAIALPPDLAAGWQALLCLLIGGAGIWALLRRRGLAPGAAAVAVVSCQTAGWALANLHIPMKVDATVWLPWCLWAVDGMARGRRGAGFLLTLFTAFSYLAGWVPIAVFCTITVACCSAWLLRRRPSTLLRVAGYLLLGVVGASVQVLPTAEASQLSVRQGQSPARIAGQTLPLGIAAGLVVPELFGNPEAPSPGPHPVAAWLSGPGDGERLSAFNCLEWHAFAGLAVVALALVALLAVPRRAALPLLLLLAAWGFAQGWPWLHWLYQLPGMNLGAPNRVLAVQWFLWPWLAALGTQALLDQRPRAIATLLTLAALACTAALGFWLSFDAGAWAEDLVANSAARFGVPRSLVEQTLPAAGRQAAGMGLLTNAQHLLGTGLALLAAALGTRWLARQSSDSQLTFRWSLLVMLAVLCAALLPIAISRPDRLWLPLSLGLAYCLLFFRQRQLVTMAAWLPLLVLIGIEGSSNGATHLQPRQLQGEVFPASRAIDAIARAAGDGRVLRLDESSGPVPADVVALARPNLLEAYGIHDLTPYYVFTPRTLVELFEALDPDTRYASMISSIPRVDLLGHPILDMVRVTAVISRRHIEHPRLTEFYRSPGFHVYHRSGVPPAVHLVREAREVDSDAAALALLAAEEIDPAQQIVLAPDTRPAPDDTAPGNSVTQLHAERVTASRYDVEIEDSAGGWLVFHEQFYPGWHATIDGEDTELLRVNHAQRAVRVPAGKHVVKTWYAPRSLQLGGLLSLLALALAAWCSFRRWAPLNNL